MPKKKDYSSWSKEELIEYIHRLEKRKKYGLVWDEERTKEEVVERCRRELPVLVGVPELDITTDPSQPTHILIEGDNYHALSVLNYTHEKAVDVIYIDPPYNTGNVSWMYNNRIVDKEDGFRHSKFIAFMEKRIRMGRNMLKPSGLFVCAIDDYEMQNVRHILDDIFGEKNRLSTIVVVHNPRGRNDDRYFATMHEYMLIYAYDRELAKVKYFPFSEEELEQFNKTDDISDYGETPFMRTGNNSNRKERPGLYYPIYYNPITNSLQINNEPGFIELLPINESGEEKTWRWGKDTFLRDKDTELLVRSVKGEYRIFKKRRITRMTGSKPTTVWYEPRYDASSHGIMVLQNIFRMKNVFPYPKSIWTIRDILSLLCDNDSVIVDFMAGSGTTGHSVQLLNAEQNLRGGAGLRRSILCTNNEGNICTDICQPRLRGVFSGYTDLRSRNIPGLGGNLKYFRTDFVPSDSTDENKLKLTLASVEMLCLRENTFQFVKEGPEIASPTAPVIARNEVTKQSPPAVFASEAKQSPAAGSQKREGAVWQIYCNSERHTVILFDQRLIPEIKREIKALDTPVSVYIFSLGDDDFASLFEDMGGKVKVCSIPEAILRVYRRIFK